jgi:hypothetical protein
MRQFLRATSHLVPYASPIPDPAGNRFPAIPPVAKKENKDDKNRKTKSKKY